jgi:hypothetical protein
MAYSASTGFRFKKTFYGSEQPAPLIYRITNSATIKIGDAVRIDDSGYVNVVGVGGPVGGICVGIVDENEINPLSFGYINNTGCTLIPDDSVTAASDNETRTTGHVQAQIVIDPAGSCLWYNDADGDLAVTNTFQLFDIVTAGQVDAGTLSDTSGQFQLISRDPDNDGDASKGLFRIAESQLMTQVGNQTTAQAIITA